MLRGQTVLDTHTYGTFYFLRNHFRPAQASVGGASNIKKANLKDWNGSTIRIHNIQSFLWRFSGSPLCCEISQAVIIMFMMWYNCVIPGWPYIQMENPLQRKAVSCSLPTTHCQGLAAQRCRTNSGKGRQLLRGRQKAASSRRSSYVSIENVHIAIMLPRPCSPPNALYYT